MHFTLSNCARTRRVPADRRHAWTRLCLGERSEPFPSRHKAERNHAMVLGGMHRTSLPHDCGSEVLR